MRRGRLDDVVSKQINLSCKTKTMNNYWSQEDSHRGRYVNTRLNLGLFRLPSNMGVDCDSALLVKFHNTATIASLRPNFAVGRIIESSIKHILYYQSTRCLFSS